MKTIYVAAPFNRRDAAGAVRDRLVSIGWESTAHWIDNHIEEVEPGSDRARTEAIADLRDIRRADYFVLLNDGASTTGAMHVETGYAIALRKRVFVIGSRSNLFHAHPAVVTLETIEAFIEMTPDPAPAVVESLQNAGS